MKKEFKVGETFQFGLVKLKVEKADINSTFPCDKCYFNNRCCIDKLKDSIGSCRWEDNGIDRIFIKVEEDDAAKLYKLKHKPTGLYYQPVSGRWSGQKTNLSKKGKIYQTGQNGLIGTGDTITISVSNRQYNSNKELFDSLGIYLSQQYHEYMLRCKKSDFEKEYIVDNK